METLYKVFVSIIPPVVGILVYVFIESKRKARTKTMPVQNAETLSKMQKHCLMMLATYRR